MQIDFRLRRISSYGGGEARPELKLPTYEEAMEAKRKDEMTSEESNALSCKTPQEEGGGGEGQGETASAAVSAVVAAAADPPAYAAAVSLAASEPPSDVAVLSTTAQLNNEAAAEAN